MGAALEVAHRTELAGHALVAERVHAAASSAFFYGMSAGCLVAAGVSAVGAVVAAVLLPAQPTQTADHAQPFAAPAPAGAAD